VPTVRPPGATDRPGGLRRPQGTRRPACRGADRGGHPPGRPDRADFCLFFPGLNPSSRSQMRTDVHQGKEKTMAIRNKEIDLVQACLDWLLLRRIKAWRTNNTGVYDPARKVYRTFQGLRGVSDILGIVPQTVTLDGERIIFGNFLAIEVKRPGEQLR